MAKISDEIIILAAILAFAMAIILIGAIMYPTLAYNLEIPYNCMNNTEVCL